MKERKFELHLPGLLKVLAEHLYSSKKVGIRELIQNAHDSCFRRKVEENDSRYHPAITLSLHTKERALTIEDNGAGMTEEEIIRYLATIGRGYTREMREQLSLSGSEEAGALIGQFGLGFLSAFLLAEEVKVLTRSYKSEQAMLWQAKGDENYQLTPAEKSTVGTSVWLRVKPEASFILQEDTFQETVRSFADFLPVPIYWQDDPDPINLMETPWEADEPESAARMFIRRVFQEKAPLLILPLHDGKVNLGHDTLTVPMRGFLYVPAGSVVSVREYGEMRVYIRRMFICDRQKDLLPPWARFVRGVIDCPMLQPTASREEIHQDDHFDFVRQALEEQLHQGLLTLAREDPGRWKHLVQSHSDLIVGWAVKDTEFFDQVKDLVALRTSRGLLTLPEYLETSGGSLYYVTRELGSLQEQVLAEGRNVPAIDASWFAVEPFLEKYASMARNVRLVQLDGETESLFRSTSEKPFASLLAYFEEQGIPARVASFHPKEVPALMVYPPNAELLRDSQQALETQDLPGSIAPLVQAFVNDHLNQREDWHGTLYLNSACPFIKEVAKHANPKTLPSILQMLYQTARLFCGRMLQPKEATQAFAKWTQALQEMLS